MDVVVTDIFMGLSRDQAVSEPLWFSLLRCRAHRNLEVIQEVIPHVASKNLDHFMSLGQNTVLLS